MSKISTYPSADAPLSLSDRLIGTEAIRTAPTSTPLATKNFSLGELLQLFSSNFPAASLQAVLNTGNTATQNINLTGTIDVTLIKPDNIEDTSGSQGTVFQYLSKGTSSINWVDLPVDNLQSVLNAGNTATQNITLVGNITTTKIIPGNIQDDTSGIGTTGQVLSKTASGIRWINNSIVYTSGLADVLSVGNTATNNITLIGDITATRIIKQGGTSIQYLMADGSVSTGPSSPFVSLTTIGSSGASTLIGGVLNVPTYTLAGLGGQPQLNGTGFVKALGTTVSYDNSTYYLASNPDGFITSAALTGYVPTSRTLTINGTLYDLTADRSWSVGTVTSIGMTVPSAFNVTPSTITSSGTFAITGAGAASQYVRGDGTLANFPTSTGGGASVSYYLNGSISQGTIGGVAYKEMNGVPVIGAGTDFTINADGYIAQFITDVGDPNKLLIPAGNWNFETYFSASSGGGSPRFYIELYKYDGATFTLIATNSATPENITGGTSIDLYFTALTVPSTSLLITDRLAVRFYVIHSGRTITMHTEDSHLSQIITTFSSGLTALNGLTSQVQYFAVGTAGTDFNILSATDTHTFNLPTASAINRGALSSADWTTFNSKTTASGTTNFVSKFTGTTSLGNSLIYDNGTNVSIGSTTGLGLFNVSGSKTAASLIAIGTHLTPTLVASANNDVLVGLDIAPTFTNGAFTEVTNYAQRISGNTLQTIGTSNLYTSNVVGGGTFSFHNSIPTSSNYFLIGDTANVFINAPSSSGLIYLRINNVSYGQFMPTTGNFLLQSGGTFTDAGYRLDVAGLTRFQGTTASDTAPLGSELAAVKGTGANWTLVGTNLNVGGYTHTVGATTPLTTTLAAVIGTYYQIAYTITGRTAGSVTIAYGGTSIATTVTNNYGPIAITTGVLILTPTTDFDGNVVLSIKSIGVSSASSTFANSSGVTSIEVRANSSTSNTFIGTNAGRRNTTGVANTYIGYLSGINNTTASNNTFVGNTSGQNNTTGSSNAFIGTAVGLANTVGGSNSAFGFQTLGTNISGSANCAFGFQAGRLIADKITTASILNNSIMLGYRASPLANSQTNQIVIGYDSTGLGSNTTVLGNSSTVTTAIYGNLLLGTTTDNGVDKLQITGSTNISGQLKLGSTITNNTFTYTLPTATGTLALTSQIPTVSGTTNYLPKFTSATTFGNSQLFDNGTNVGIGTTSTSSKLNVNGDILLFGVGNAGRLTASDTAVGGASITINPQFSTGVPGIESNGVFPIAFKTNSLERMRVASNGNVGIGTTSPTSKLQVVGLVEYATNALAIAGGLTVGAFYHTAGVVKVVI